MASASASALKPDHAAQRAPVPPFTPEHEEFRASVRRFIETELAPRADEWEAKGHFDHWAFERCAELDLLGLKYPEQYGGSGEDWVADAVFVEELARCDSGGVAAGIGAHIGIATPPISKFGTEEQKQRWLVPAIKGEKIAGLAITEPDAGSDVASIRTRAERVDGGWVLNGAKTFITNGIRADVLVTAVKTTAEGGHGGLSFMCVDTTTPGITRTPLKKMGWRASDTAEIAFEDVFVPEEELLGTENQGFYLIMANFQWERLLMALGAVGAMRLVFDRTLKYVLERKAFGRPIGKFQASRHAMAEIAVSIEASADLTYAALRGFAAGQDVTQDVTRAKLLTQRAAVDAIDRCLQLHGGAGYMEEYGIERAYRDARLGPIGGGTDEVMKEILGRSLGL